MIGVDLPLRLPTRREMDRQVVRAFAADIRQLGLPREAVVRQAPDLAALWMRSPAFPRAAGGSPADWLRARGR